jgi:LIVCS family branched-chain amino acid:cation transporter
MFVIGFALFSMFFGAGNVIFPPYLGLSCGAEWFAGFAWYYLADIGLALLALFAVLRCGSTEKVTGRLGNVPSKILLSAIVLCIGPMLAIPRTAATTLEMAVNPLLSGVSPLVFSLLFFTLIAALCVRQSAVVDIVGKFLTPALLIGLLVLIVLGVVNPIGPVPDRVLVDSVVITGIEAGYQTMDVLAAILFGIIILKSAESKGYTQRRDQVKVVAGAAIVAGIALLVVYLGLTYLGVTTSRFFDLTVQRTFLMVSIVRNLLGTPGVWLFSLIVTLACITTAVALVSSAADFFSSLLKVSYTKMALAVCVFSAAAANFGLDTIVSIAAPVLNVVYPPTLVVVGFSFFEKWLPNHSAVRFAAVGALAVSIAQTLGIQAANALPLAAFGFGWLIPALVCGAAGYAFGRSKG